MTYEEAIKYLDSFIDYEKVVGYKYRTMMKLSRVAALLDGLGNPHRNFKSIHIAGTKGKGSTCALIYSILKEGGFKVGLYTSPHLIDFKERIRISSPKDRIIDEAELVTLVSRVKTFLDKFTSSSKFGSPSFFEVYTALAFLFFSIQKVDLAVLEVGLGGRLDATNVVEPLSVGITPISFDHTDKLGRTLESIAKEKCGIIKENSIVVSSEQAPQVLTCIRKIVSEKKAKLYEIGKNIFYEPITASPNGQTFNVRGIFDEYALLACPLLGRHQIINAATAIGIVETLRFHNMVVSSRDVANGIRNVNWPGRLQVVGRNPLIILDGAQNEVSARALKEAINSVFSYKNLILILGASSDKDVEGIGKNLIPISSTVFLTRANSPRAASPEDLRKRFQGYNKKTITTHSVDEAVELARQEAQPEDLVLITGSLYVVGEAMQNLSKKKTKYEKTLQD